MNNFNSLRQPAFIPLICMIALAMSAMNSCSTVADFPKSTFVPAAEVQLKTDRDKNDNYLIEIKAENLAMPRDLSPPKAVYVVWCETSGYGTFNIGAMMVKDKLKATLTTLSPFEPKRIFITSEDNTQVRYPDSQEILSIEDFKF